MHRQATSPPTQFPMYSIMTLALVLGNTKISLKSNCKVPRNPLTNIILLPAPRIGISLSSCAKKFCGCFAILFYFFFCNLSKHHWATLSNWLTCYLTAMNALVNFNWVSQTLLRCQKYSPELQMRQYLLLRNICSAVQCPDFYNSTAHSWPIFTQLRLCDRLVL